TWQRLCIFQGNSNLQPGPPSMAPAYCATILNPFAYIVYSVYDISANTKKIYFNMFEPNRVIRTQILDYIPAVSPSIAVTPGNILHLTFLNPNTGVVFYNENRYLAGWREVPHPISQPQYCSNPFVEAWGDSVFAVWTYRQNGGEHAEIWRRARGLDRPFDYWGERILKSPGASNIEADFPVMATRSVIVWQEREISSPNWDLKGDIDGTPVTIFTSPRPSTYPSIIAYFGNIPDDIGAPVIVHTLETEDLYSSGGVTLYETKHILNVFFTSSADYYDVQVGEEAISPYCLEREGYFRQNGIKMDYGRQRLIYHLPYLNPFYNYSLRMVLYQEGQSPFSYQFYLDDSLLGGFTFQPNKMETINLKIPKPLYRRDAQVILRILKNGGNYVSIAKLTILQPEEEGENGGGGQSSIISKLKSSPPVLTITPTLLRKSTLIKYEIPNETWVKIEIYDTKGKKVCGLLNSLKSAGAHKLIWDGKDASGEIVPKGIYFCRLETDGFVGTKKMVVTR
ncbi:MAG: FlgD immunoglobulin-like domain containing protein, partial [candidate division WOR-3 bacterium]